MVIDHLSTSTYFLVLAHKYTVKVVVENFVEGVVKLHGIPRSIISDQDLIFINHFWNKFFKISCTQLKMSSCQKSIDSLKLSIDMWNSIFSV